METIRTFTYLCSRVSTVGVCEATVSVRTWFGWVIFIKCGDLQYVRRFSLMLKESFYNCYVRPAILYGKELMCLEGKEVRILRWTEGSMVRSLARVQIKHGKS